MRYLITGGSGFVGRALCSDLCAAGHEVAVLSRSPRRARRRLPDSVRTVGTFEEVSGAEAVVNLAGENLAAGRWTPARKQALRESRIGTTRRLVQWIGNLTDRPQVLVSASAIGYYGARGDEAVDESTPPADDFPARLCRDWEAEAERAADLGVRVCVLRIGLVLGSDGGVLARMLPAFRLGLGGPIGSGRQWMSWIHRQDLVSAIRWCAERAQPRGANNATAPNPVTNLEFARALGRALHRPALLPVPARLLKLALGEMATLLLTGQKVLPERLLAEGFTLRYPRLDDALAALLH
ncbi:MAG: TIGR01777 family oxidoreductase [Gammaproteobacteria bacterium]|nr:TIGR01777 family oxidoreductase [Gammaproteobacteria bacterium]